MPAAKCCTPSLLGAGASAVQLQQFDACLYVSGCDRDVLISSPPRWRLPGPAQRGDHRNGRPSMECCEENGVFGPLRGVKRHGLQRARDRGRARIAAEHEMFVCATTAMVSYASEVKLLVERAPVRGLAAPTKAAANGATPGDGPAAPRASTPDSRPGVPSLDRFVAHLGLRCRFTRSNARS